MATLITLSVIKADVGGYVGHSSVHPALLDGAREQMSQAIERKLLIDGYVTHCGDDLQLIMTHQKGTDNERDSQVCVGHVCCLHGNSPSS